MSVPKDKSAYSGVFKKVDLDDLLSEGQAENGETHEEVIDVACANGAEVNPETNRCPANGATVDLTDCSINPETGSAQLATVWRDPNFDANTRAFYYARVIENPTCRWSTWDAIRAGVDPRPDLAKTLQERACGRRLPITAHRSHVYRPQPRARRPRRRPERLSVLRTRPSHGRPPLHP